MLLLYNLFYNRYLVTSFPLPAYLRLASSLCERARRLRGVPLNKILFFYLFISLSGKCSAINAEEATEPLQAAGVFWLVEDSKKREENFDARTYLHFDVVLQLGIQEVEGHRLLKFRILWEK